MRPVTTYTPPYSPAARAVHRITPYRRPHLTPGSVTHENICQPLAPRLRAASSSSAPFASITGTNSRATNGTVTNAVTRINPGTPFTKNHAVPVDLIASRLDDVLRGRPAGGTSGPPQGPGESAAGRSVLP